MSTGYQTVIIESVSEGKAYDPATQGQTVPVTYEAPEGKRVIACYVSSTGGRYGDSPGQLYGRPNNDGTEWVFDQSANMAPYEGAPTPPDVYSTLRYVVIDA